MPSLCIFYPNDITFLGYDLLAKGWILILHGWSTFSPVLHIFTRFDGLISDEFSIIYLLNFASTIDIDNELCAFTELAANIDGSAHLFNYVLAYREAKACSWGISARVLVKLAEVHEKIFQAFLRYANAGINDTDLQF